MPDFDFGENAASWIGWQSSESLHFKLGVIGAGILGIFGVVFLSLIARQKGPSDISNLPGPIPTSRLVGSYLEFHRSVPGIVQRKWARQFGQTFRMKGVFNEAILVVSDVDALWHIFNTNPLNYEVPGYRITFMRSLFGRSLACLRAEEHARLRRMLQPAFGPIPIRGMKDSFDRTTAMLVEKLDQLLSVEKAGSATPAGEVIDMGKQFRYTALDALWLAGFGTDLGSVTDPESPHVAPYIGLKPGGIRPPSTTFQILVGVLVGWLPSAVQIPFMKLDKKGAKACMDFCKHGRVIAKRLIGQKIQSIDLGEDPGSDVLAKVVKANRDPSSRYRLNSYGMEGTVGQLHLAGHETSANLLNWMFWKLSVNQEIQHAVRAEVLAAVEASPGDILSRDTLDELPMFNAVIKETLRKHPALTHLFREAMGDDVLPLSEPVQLSNGVWKNSIAIGKGREIIVNISAVHHNVRIWGPDADEWKPERWLDGRYTKDTPKVPGVYSNLLAFGAGPQLCIGWQFSLLEIQTVAAQVLASYHFDPAPGVEIASMMGIADMTAVVGDPEGLGKLPLLVRRV